MGPPQINNVPIFSLLLANACLCKRLCHQCQRRPVEGRRKLAFSSMAILHVKHVRVFLNALADEIDARGNDITAIGVAKTGFA